MDLLYKLYNKLITNCNNITQLTQLRNVSQVHNKKLIGDEIANVNFLYDDIVHALKIQ